MHKKVLIRNAFLASAEALAARMSGVSPSRFVVFTAAALICHQKVRGGGQRLAANRERADKVRRKQKSDKPAAIF